MEPHAVVVRAENSMWRHECKYVCILLGELAMLTAQLAGISQYPSELFVVLGQTYRHNSRKSRKLIGTEFQA